MKNHAVLSAFALAATMANPALGASTATAPDFAGIWWHPSLPGPEPLASGRTGLKNLTRRKEDGASDYNELVGDYSNPILQPWAAEIVKKHGELSKSGIVYPNPASQCWPEPLPFIYKNFAIQIFQQSDRITILYDQDHEVRHVRLSQAHPKNLMPSWYGDSIAHYDGDTLVIDTVGQKSGPFAMLDLYGTPYTKALHVVERYRLIDYDEAKEGLDRDQKENFRAGVGTIDRLYRGKHLQIRYTVEDEGVFTTPWSGTVTYGRGSTEWPETVCAENVHVYYDKDTAVPAADKPDF
jgi:hypothetical protein